MADGNESSEASLLKEWRQNVMNSLTGIHSKLDGFDERLRLVEVGVIQKAQIDRLEREKDELEKRVRSLEGYKQRLIGYALGAGLIAGGVFELVKLIWSH